MAATTSSTGQVSRLQQTTERLRHETSQLRERLRGERDAVRALRAQHSAELRAERTAARRKRVELQAQLQVNKTKNTLTSTSSTCEQCSKHRALHEAEIRKLNAEFKKKEQQLKGQLNEKSTNTSLVVASSCEQCATTKALHEADVRKLTSDFKKKEQQLKGQLNDKVAPNVISASAYIASCEQCAKFKAMHDAELRRINVEFKKKEHQLKCQLNELRKNASVDSTDGGIQSCHSQRLTADLAKQKEVIKDLEERLQKAIDADRLKAADLRAQHEKHVAELSRITRANRHDAHKLLEELKTKDRIIAQLRRSAGKFRTKGEDAGNEHSQMRKLREEVRKNEQPALLPPACDPKPETVTHHDKFRQNEVELNVSRKQRHQMVCGAANEEVIEHPETDTDSAVSSAPSSLSPQPCSPAAAVLRDHATPPPTSLSPQPSEGYTTPPPGLWPDLESYDDDEGVNIELAMAKRQVRELERALLVTRATKSSSRHVTALSERVRQLEDREAELLRELGDLREQNELLEFRVLELAECPDKSSISTSNWDISEHRDVATATDDILELLNDEPVRTRIADICSKTDNIEDKKCLLQVLMLLYGLDELSKRTEIYNSDAAMQIYNEREVTPPVSLMSVRGARDRTGPDRDRLIAKVPPFTGRTAESDDDRESPLRSHESSTPPTLVNSRGTQTDVTEGTTDEDSTKSLNLTTEVRKLDKLRETIDRNGRLVVSGSGCAGGCEQKHLRQLEFYRERVDVLERKLCVYESSGELQARQLADRLSREVRLEAQVKQLTSALNKLQSENSRLEEERCELEEAENDTRLRCQRLESDILQLERSRMAAKRRSRENRQQAAYWESMVSKYEERNYELEERECELRHRLEVMEKTAPAILLFNMWKMMQDDPKLDVASATINKLKNAGNRGRSSSIPRAKSRSPQRKATDIACTCGSRDGNDENVEEKIKDLEHQRHKLVEAKQNMERKVLALESQLSDLKHSASNTSPSSSPAPCSGLSATSLMSGDYEFVTVVQELKERENDMRKRIDELEKREAAYMETLQQADEIWAEMECDYKKRISEAEQNEANIRDRLRRLEKREPVNYDELDNAERELTAQAQRLSRDNIRLQTEKKRLEKELQCLCRMRDEKSRELETQMDKNKGELEYERRRSQELEQRLSDGEAALAEASRTHSAEVDALRERLARTSNELVHLEVTNGELREEVETLEGKIAEVERGACKRAAADEQVIRGLSQELNDRDRELADMKQQDLASRAGERLGTALQGVKTCDSCSHTVSPNLIQAMEGVRTLCSLMSHPPSRPPDDTQVRYRSANRNVVPADTYKDKCRPICKNLILKQKSTSEKSVHKNKEEVCTPNTCKLNKKSTSTNILSGPSSKASSVSKLSSVVLESSGTESRKTLKSVTISSATSDDEGEISDRDTIRAEAGDTIVPSQKSSLKSSKASCHIDKCEKKSCTDTCSMKSRNIPAIVATSSGGSAKFVSATNSSKTVELCPVETILPSTRESTCTISSCIAPCMNSSKVIILADDQSVNQYDLQTEVMVAGQPEYSSIQAKVDMDTDHEIDGITVTASVTKSGNLELTTESPPGLIEHTMMYTPSGNMEITTEFFPGEAGDLDFVPSYFHPEEEPLPPDITSQNAFPLSDADIDETSATLTDAGDATVYETAATLPDAHNTDSDEKIFEKISAIDDRRPKLYSAIYSTEESGAPKMIEMSQSRSEQMSYTESIIEKRFKADRTSISMEPVTSGDEIISNVTSDRLSFKGKDSTSSGKIRKSSDGSGDSLVGLLQLVAHSTEKITEIISRLSDATVNKTTATLPDAGNTDADEKIYEKISTTDETTYIEKTVFPHPDTISAVPGILSEITSKKSKNEVSSALSGKVQAKDFNVTSATKPKILSEIITEEAKDDGRPKLYSAISSTEESGAPKMVEISQSGSDQMSYKESIIEKPFKVDRTSIFMEPVTPSDEIISNVISDNVSSKGSGDYLVGLLQQVAHSTEKITEIINRLSKSSSKNSPEKLLNQNEVIIETRMEQDSKSSIEKISEITTEQKISEITGGKKISTNATEIEKVSKELSEKISGETEVEKVSKNLSEKVSDKIESEQGMRSKESSDKDVPGVKSKESSKEASKTLTVIQSTETTEKDNDSADSISAEVETIASVKELNDSTSVYSEGESLKESVTKSDGKNSIEETKSGEIKMVAFKLQIQTQSANFESAYDDKEIESKNSDELVVMVPIMEPLSKKKICACPTTAKPVLMAPIEPLPKKKICACSTAFQTYQRKFGSYFSPESKSQGTQSRSECSQRRSQDSWSQSRSQGSQSQPRSQESQSQPRSQDSQSKSQIKSEAAISGCLYPGGILPVPPPLNAPQTKSDGAITCNQCPIGILPVDLYSQPQVSQQMIYLYPMYQNQPPQQPQQCVPPNVLPGGPGPSQTMQPQMIPPPPQPMSCLCQSYVPCPIYPCGPPSYGFGYGTPAPYGAQQYPPMPQQMPYQHVQQQCPALNQVPYQTVQNQVPYQAVQNQIPYQTIQNQVPQETVPEEPILYENAQQPDQYIGEKFQDSEKNCCPRCNVYQLAPPPPPTRNICCKCESYTKGVAGGDRSVAKSASEETSGEVSFFSAEEKAEEDTSGVEAAEEDTSEVEAAEEDTSGVETAEKDTSEEDVSGIEASEEDTSGIEADKNETSVEDEAEGVEEAEGDTSEVQEAEEDTLEVESAEGDLSEVESAEEDTSGVEAAEEDTSGVQAAEEDTSGEEAAEKETSGVEAAEEDTSRVEASVVEASVVEASVVEAAKEDTSVVEASVVEASVVEASVVQASVVAASVVEASREDTSVVEAAREDTSRVVPAEERIVEVITDKKTGGVFEASDTCQSTTETLSVSVAVSLDESVSVITESKKSFASAAKESTLVEEEPILVSSLKSPMGSRIPVAVSPTRSSISKRDEENLLGTSGGESPNIPGSGKCSPKSDKDAISGKTSPKIVLSGEHSPSGKVSPKSENAASGKSSPKSNRCSNTSSGKVSGKISPSVVSQGNRGSRGVKISFHSKDCSCKECKCNPCKDPKIPPRKRPDFNDEEGCPLCRCEICRCKNCIDPKRRDGAALPCDCEECVCAPCKDPKIICSKSQELTNIASITKVPATTLDTNNEVTFDVPPGEGLATASTPMNTTVILEPRATDESSSFFSSTTDPPIDELNTCGPAATQIDELSTCCEPAATPIDELDQLCACGTAIDKLCSCGTAATPIDELCPCGTAATPIDKLCTCETAATPIDKLCTCGTDGQISANTPGASMPSSQRTEITISATISGTADTINVSGTISGDLGAFTPIPSPSRRSVTICPFAHPVDCDCPQCICKPCPDPPKPSSNANATLHRQQYLEPVQLANITYDICSGSSTATSTPAGTCPYAQSVQVGGRKVDIHYPRNANSSRIVNVCPSGHPVNCECPQCICNPCSEPQKPSSNATFSRQRNLEPIQLANVTYDIRSRKSTTSKQGANNNTGFNSCTCKPPTQTTLPVPTQTTLPVVPFLKPKELASVTYVKKPSSGVSSNSCMETDGPKELANVTYIKKHDVFAASTTSSGDEPCICRPSVQPATSVPKSTVNSKVCPSSGGVSTKKSAKHSPLCDCDECKCKLCPPTDFTSNKLPPSKLGPAFFKSTSAISGSTKCEFEISIGEKAPVRAVAMTGTEDLRNLDTETIKRRLIEMENETKGRANEIAQIRKFMSGLQSQCTCGQNNLMTTESRSFEQTISGLQCALTFLQEKCRKKDRMITAFTEELRQRTDSGVFDSVLHKIAAEKDTQSNTVCDRMKSRQVMRTPAEKPCAPVRPVKDDGCQCSPRAPMNVDPSPLAVTEVRRIAPDSLLLKWERPASQNIRGYEVEVNGEVKSRVHSAGRNATVLNGLVINGTMNLAVIAISVDGDRCSPAAKAVYQGHESASSTNNFKKGQCVC